MVADKEISSWDILREPNRILLEETHPVLGAGPLVRQQPQRPVKELLAEFF